MRLFLQGRQESRKTNLSFIKYVKGILKLSPLSDFKDFLLSIPDDPFNIVSRQTERWPGLFGQPEASLLMCI